MFESLVFGTRRDELCQEHDPIATKQPILYRGDLRKIHQHQGIDRSRKQEIEPLKVGYEPLEICFYTIEMVGLAVWCEPVSGLTPQIADKNRKFRQNCRLEQNTCRIMTPFQRLAFNSALRGTGYFSGRAGNSKLDHKQYQGKSLPYPEVGLSFRGIALSSSGNGLQMRESRWPFGESQLSPCGMRLPLPASTLPLTDTRSSIADTTHRLRVDVAPAFGVV